MEESTGERLDGVQIEWKSSHVHCSSFVSICKEESEREIQKLKLLWTESDVAEKMGFEGDEAELNFGETDME